MGDRNSSLTRVQPVFKALYQKDQSGLSWLRPLLSLGSRGSEYPPGDSFSALQRGPVFEFPADPPVSFLMWLLRNPDKLTIPAAKVSAKWSAVTRENRNRFLEGDKLVVNEAISIMSSAMPLPQAAWWRLEGQTRVDCALFTKSAVVFIEGKRTELGPDKRVSWYPSRNQVLRNLDCAYAFAKRNGMIDFFAMLIVDEELVRSDRRRQLAIDSIISEEVVRTSLPQYSKPERDDIMKHYLGHTTWQTVCARFAVSDDVLVDHT